MTGSALLIGLIPAIHNAGWQLPQLFIAGWVAKQSRYKPLVVGLTIAERLPFLGLGILAAATPRISVPLALTLTYGLLIVQGLGAGVTANPWTTMIGKIIPAERRSTFFGVQSAAANVLASASAFAAGVILEKLPSPQDFTYCFLLCSFSMVISWYFLNRTREPDNLPAAEPAAGLTIDAEKLRGILRSDKNFCWFLLGRMITQLGVMGFAFYTVYAVRVYGASELVVGSMTSVMLATQIGANVLMGWIGDRWSRKGVMEIGLAAGVLSALLAILAPSAGWFYPVYALAALANVAAWTIGIAMSLEFGAEADRPAYIGLANTLIAPANILAPFLGGWLADYAGYPAAFTASAAGALVALAIFHWFVHEQPRKLQKLAPTSQAPANSA
jgi:MFS family permease